MPLADHSLASNVPAMLQWTRNDEDGYIGLGHPTQSSTLVAELGFDASQHTAVLRFCISVWLKERGRKVSLYILVHPAKIRRVSKQKVQDTPPLVTNSFIAGVQQCTCAQDVFPLRILLHDPAGIKIIGPSNVTNFAPNTKPSGRILDALQSLSYAHDLVLYLPISPALTSRIDAFCDDVAAGILRPNGNHYDLNSLYGGIGGVDISSSLQAGISESPPVYDGVVHAAPELGSSSSAKR